MSTLGDLKRLRQIAVIAARHGFADMMDRSGVWARLGRKEQVEVSAESKSATTARRFVLMLSELGPTFVKLGQVLSTRADLLPAAFIDELSTLQDQVPPISLDEVKAQLRASFGPEAESLFREIDPTPLAAASIAQAHRAVTNEGVEVVVKVQRPNIEAQIRADLSVLHTLARMLEAVVEEMGVYTPTAVIEEFDRAIREELDFLNEAQNIRAFRATHVDRPTIRIPQVYDELSSRTVLTMEMIRAPKLSVVQLTEQEKETLAKNMLEESFRQLFEDGLFHGDPHPGNLLVEKTEAGPVLALIDFGLVGRVSKAMQESLISLITAVALKDSESIARLLYRVSVPDSRANLLGFKQDIDKVLSTYLPEKLSDINARFVMRDLLDLAVKYRIRVPKEYAILARASITTEGILRSLYPNMNVGEAAMPFAQRMFQNKYDPSQLQGGLLKTLLRFESMATDLPMQLSQILLDLEAGKFNATIKSPELVQLNRTLRSLAAVAFLGLCACGFIVGTFISFAGQPWQVFGIPGLGVLGGIAASFLFGVTVTWYLFGGRSRKLSFSRHSKDR